MVLIGVSVAVPDPWGAELQEFRVGLGDVDAAGIPSHITLLPPLEVEIVRMTGVHEHLESAAAKVRPFEVHLRGTGTFRPVSPVVFVNVVRGISSCEQLAQAVRTGPLAIDPSFPYHPHVTIAHHLGEELLDRAFDDLEKFDCRFTADHFSLYVRHAAKGWTPVHDYKLAR